MAFLLSEELWLLVFEHVLDSHKPFAPDHEFFTLPGQEPILPLLLVCRQWQRISEPLMYRHVQIHSPAYARMLDKKISYLSTTRDVDVWHWVRTFHASRRSSGVLVTPARLGFLRAVNLIELQTNMPVSSETLATLRRSCPSLRSLDVSVLMNAHEAMAEVGRFEHVTQLRVMLVPPTLSTNTLADLPAWDMPAVTHFWWRDSWNGSAHGPSFVSRCRFPRLTHLEFQNHSSFTDLERIPALHIIGRFFDAHRGIRFLNFDECLLSIVPLVRARHIQIVCRHHCPPRALVALLRPEVKTLGLQLKSFRWKHRQPELITSLREVLTQFAAEDNKPPTLETIRLLTSDVDESPQDDPMKEETFLGTLRPHVLALNARGIRIFVHDTQVCV